MGSWRSHGRPNPVPPRSCVYSWPICRLCGPPGQRRAPLVTDLPVEVECETSDQVGEALAAGVDAILLDNMTLDELRSAVATVGGRARLEASGGITLENIRAVAETGVDEISVGALTHSARSLDVSLELR